MDERPNEIATLKDELRIVILKLLESGPEGIAVIEEVKQQALAA